MEANPEFREEFCSRFRQPHGFNLYQASTVSEAWDLLASHQVGIIISGCPADENLTFLSDLRRSGHTIPFIYLTDAGTDEILLTAYDTGADYILPRTATSDTLYTTLSGIIHRIFSQEQQASPGQANQYPIPSDRESLESIPRDHSFIDALMDAIPAPVFCRDIYGVYQDSNKAFEDLIGYAKSEIIGKTMYDLFSRELAEHYQHMDELIIEHPYVQQYEYRIQNRKGEYLDVLFSKNVLCDEQGSVCGIIGIIFDISDRKEFEKIVYASEEKYRTLADYTYDWEAWLSPEGMYRYVSPSSERISGYRAEEFLADPELVIRITHPDDRDKIQSHYQGVLYPDTGARQIDYRIITKSGEERWISHICQSVFRDDGTWIGRRENKRDITFRKEIEKAYQQANIKLNLLSSITRHDVLNQLSVLIGFTDMALEMNRDLEIDIMLKRVMAAGETISEQISFTRTYQDIGIQDPVWQHIPVVISKAAAAIRIATIEVDNALTCLEVLADPLLEKVFFCLLDNSERHGKRVTRSRFSCRFEEENLIIVYEDDGIGIDPFEKGRIFDRGFGKNTGYGLFLAKEILGISGNSITETGTQGEGARFEIGFSPGTFRRLSPT